MHEAHLCKYCIMVYVQIFDEDLSNYSLSCKRDDDDISSCVVHTECARETYASAVCFKEGQVIDEGKMARVSYDEGNMVRILFNERKTAGVSFVEGEIERNPNDKHKMAGI